MDNESKEIKIKYNFKYTSEAKLGKHCFIYRGPEVEQIAEDLGREDQKLCLKVFYDQDKPDNWGDDKADKTDKRNTTLKEAIQIQNICAFEGLAPRVYGLMRVKWSGRGRKGKIFKDKICKAQITDDLGSQYGTGQEAKEIYEKIIELGKRYGWKVNYKEYGSKDVMQGKFVDFQSFNLADEYLKKIKTFIYESGKWGKTHYQAIPELDIGKFRKTKLRIKELKLDKIDFNGKTILDVGCSSGVFCNYAASRGAKRVVGIDLVNAVKASQLLSNYLGYWNNDYRVVDLEKTIYKDCPFDIVLFLSMLYHIGYPDWLPRLVKGLMILEWNHWHKKKGLSVEECEAKTFEMLKKDFRQVSLVGRASDHGNKAIWHCLK